MRDQEVPQALQFVSFPLAGSWWCAEAVGCVSELQGRRGQPPLARSTLDCQSKQPEVIWVLEQEIPGLLCRAHIGDRMKGACVHCTQQENQAVPPNKTPQEQPKPEN